jgi:hypothetical protein
VVVRLLLVLIVFSLQSDIASTSFKHLHVLAVATLTGLFLDLSLDFLSHGLLLRPTIHPFWLLIVKVASNLKTATRVADRTFLIAFLATKTTRPAARVGAHF